MSNKTICPFLNKVCLETGCTLWGSVTIPTGGKLAGTVNETTATGCSLALNTYLLRQILLKPPVMMMAPQKQPLIKAL